MLIDRFGRQVTYLRISVTDRCNLRCVYCMPSDGVTQKTHEQIMRYEEIAQIVGVCAANGVRKVRITGGEPLIRKDLPELIAMIHATPGIEDISLTTNGILLNGMVEALASAGLKRINISLDTLEAGKFSRITRGGSFSRTWEGILAAEAAGLTPIKLNVVAMRSVNDDELLAIANLALERGWHVRFIELMPINNQQTWGDGFPEPSAIYFSTNEIFEILKPLQLEPLASADGCGPAREYQPRHGEGVIGFITPVSEKFCDTCNRLRITADGNLRPCLLSDIEIPLLPALRAGEPILPILQQAIDLKPSGHELATSNRPLTRCMLQIGG
ncbi:MAG: GTP 3',8-cyclase MoaA [Anaerolineae bacterium]|nr:GTP 3',8-cyclase MoaA [Anaerolineae bacterium]